MATPAGILRPTISPVTPDLLRGPASVEKLAASATLEPCDVTPRHLPRSSTDSCAPPQQAFIPRAAAHAPCTPNPRTPPPTSTTLPAAYLWRAARRRHLALVSGEARFGRCAVHIGRRWQSRSKITWHWTRPNPAETPHNGRPCRVVATVYGHDGRGCPRCKILHGEVRLSRKRRAASCFIVLKPVAFRTALLSCKGTQCQTAASLQESSACARACVCGHNAHDESHHAVRDV